MEEHKEYPGLKPATEEKPKVEWDLFENKYFKLEEGQQARLIMTGWHSVPNYKYRDDQSEGKPALVIQILYEGGKKITHEKFFITSSKKTADMIKPFIDEAERNRARTINVLVIKQGKTYLVYA